MNARRIIAGLILAAAAATATWPGRVAAQAIQRSLIVSVLDEAGAPVPDLGPADFIVREDNNAREVLRVAPAGEPMQIAVLVDTSTAARDDISYFRSALPPFLAMLTKPTASDARNQVTLIGTGERPTTLTAYTTSQAELQRGVNRVFAIPDAGAYLLDAILDVCEGFKKRDAHRPVIIAITQEGSELSYRHHEQVLDPLRNSGAAFYAVAIGMPSGAMTDEARSRGLVLDEGTRDTGGRRDTILSPMALDTTLQRLGEQLTHQYLVTYAHPDSLLPPERVTVAARQPTLKASGTVVRDRFSQGRR